MTFLLGWVSLFHGPVLLISSEEILSRWKMPRKFLRQLFQLQELGRITGPSIKTLGQASYAELIWTVSEFDRSENK